MYRVQRMFKQRKSVGKTKVNIESGNVTIETQSRPITINSEDELLSNIFLLKFKFEVHS